MSRYNMKGSVVALAVVVAIMALSWRTRNYDYQCGKCGRKFNLTVWKAAISAHIMGNRYVKCPNCGKWSWANPTPKE